MLPDLENRRRELCDGGLLLPNDALAFLDEADTHRDGDPVCGGLIDVQHPVEEARVLLVLLEE